MGSWLKKFENEGDKILGLIIIVLLIETSHLLKLKWKKLEWDNKKKHKRKQFYTPPDMP